MFACFFLQPVFILINEYIIYLIISMYIFTQNLLYRIDNQSGATVSGENKLRFYSSITHQVHQMAGYLLSIKNFSIRSFTRFRISNHNLMIEKGRHHSRAPPLAVNDWVCPLCDMGEVEDIEVYFLLVCSLLCIFFCFSTCTACMERCSSF